MNSPAIKHAADIAATLGTIYAGVSTVLQAVTPFFTGLSAIMAFAWWCRQWLEYRRTKRQEALNVDL